MKNKRKQEWRFVIANREARIGCVLAIINFIWWYGFAYGLGSKPPEEYTYILGFPAWIFFSLILGTVFMFALVFFVVKFMLTEIPLEDEEESEEGEDEVNNR
ncbi:YhdT family protein [Virgibacillus sp. NKC19-3]|uniref:YhdT family protein n=1 Tax=Virgibacillus saliphilus TaxID=2831674 RepID=UPI001C9B8ED9|nr:YhdT family protein [Virgibacillus sp. NKC19-3]MBY7144451.1 YhdT family protein [Virgibacillus sp. NKC19-3]